MARTYEQAKAELEGSKEEIKEVNEMSEQEACYMYNVDSKNEIVSMIKEDIESLEKEVEYLTPEMYEPEYYY